MNPPCLHWSCISTSDNSLCTKQVFQKNNQLVTRTFLLIAEKLDTLFFKSGQIEHLAIPITTSIDEKLDSIHRVEPQWRTEVVWGAGAHKKRHQLYAVGHHNAEQLQTMVKIKIGFIYDSNVTTASTLE